MVERVVIKNPKLNINESYASKIANVLTLKYFIYLLVVTLASSVALYFLIEKEVQDMKYRNIACLIAYAAVGMYICAVGIESFINYKRYGEQVRLYRYIMYLMKNRGELELEVVSKDGVACVLDSDGRKVCNVAVENRFGVGVSDEVKIDKNGITVRCSNEAIRRVIGEHMLSNESKVES